MPNLQITKDVSPSVAEAMEAVNFHGVNGIWSDDCGLERGVLSQYVKPYGILQYLPAFPTRVDVIRIGSITGFQPDVEDEPDGACDTGPTGLISTCRLQFDLGSIKRSSKTIEWVEAQRRLNRGDENFSMSGYMLGPNELGAFSSGIFGPASRNVLNNTTELQMQNIAQSIALELGKMVWTGDPAGAYPANTPGGGKKSFAGFDLLIKTGYTDAVTGDACPTMDSQIYDFGYQDVCTGELTIGEGEGSETFNLIQLLQAAAWRNEVLAEESFVTMAGVLVMNKSLFHHITDCYVCQYNTNFCATNVNFINDYAVSQRDAMRAGKYLVLNGQVYIVVLDNGIPVQTATTSPDDLAGTQRASDIYFIPLTVNGTAVTYLRYQDLRAGTDEAAASGRFGPSPMFTWTDDGKYVLTKQWVETCYMYSARILPGLVFLSPQFAWRINNVMWHDAIPLRSPYPDDEDFVIDTPLY